MNITPKLFPVSRCTDKPLKVPQSFVTPPSTCTHTPVRPAKSNSYSMRFPVCSVHTRHFPASTLRASRGYFTAANRSQAKPIIPSSPKAFQPTSRSPASSHRSSVLHSPCKSVQVSVFSQPVPGKCHVKPPAPDCTSTHRASGNAARPSSSAASSSAVAPLVSTSQRTSCAPPDSTRSASADSPALSPSFTFPNTVHVTRSSASRNAISLPPLCGPNPSRSASAPHPNGVLTSFVFPITVYPGPPVYSVSPPSPSTPLNPPRSTNPSSSAWNTIPS